MKRLGLALALLLTAPAASSHAAYVGQVRTATATFRLRGLDGHVLTYAMTYRSSGAGGTAEFHDLDLTLKECAGTRCATRRYVTAVAPGAYQESTDLSVTVLSVATGSLRLIVAWSSAAGFGVLPPAPDTSGGVVARSRRGATAVLLAGPDYQGSLFRYARCLDSHADVASSAGVVTAERPSVSWPSAPPAGLRATVRSPRMYTCA